MLGRSRRLDENETTTNVESDADGKEASDKQAEPAELANFDAKSLLETQKHTKYCSFQSRTKNFCRCFYLPT